MLDRTVKPQPSGLINFNPPEIHSYKLPNGLKVFHVNKNSLPIVQVNLIIGAGSIHNVQASSGISYLTSMLIDEGAGNLSGLEIAEIIEHQGSILNVSSNKEFTTITLLSLKENLIKSMEVFSLIALSPNFLEADFDRESNRLKTHILQLNDDPSFIASSEFQRIIYDSTPYQHTQYGNIDIINNLTRVDIINFYKERFYPCNSYLVVVGDISETELKNNIDEYFLSWENKGVIHNKEIKVTEQKKTITLFDKTDAAQSEIRIGHFSKDRKSKDFFARTVLNSILGGQFSSRINLNLREDKGYTYGAHSNYSYNLIGSTFSVQTSVKSENCTNAINEILKELEKIKTTVTDEELQFSKSYLIRRYPSLFETYSQIATNLSLLPVFNLEKEYFQNYISKIKSTNLDDVIRAANENIFLDNLAVVVVGNKNQIGNQLEEFATANNFEFKLLSKAN